MEVGVLEEDATADGVGMKVSPELSLTTALPPVLIWLDITSQLMAKQLLSEPVIVNHDWAAGANQLMQVQLMHTTWTNPILYLLFYSCFFIYIYIYSGLYVRLLGYTLPFNVFGAIYR